MNRDMEVRDVLALPAEDALHALALNHAEIYTSDARRAASAFVERYGFTVTGYATCDLFGAASSVLLRQGGITLVVTEGKTAHHPAVAYVRRHGDGVADLALRTADTRAAFRAALARGARPVYLPVERDGFLLVIEGFGDVRHTLVPPPVTPSAAPLPHVTPVASQAPGGGGPGMNA